MTAAKMDRCVELTINAYLGLMQDPTFQELRETGWEAVEIDVCEDRGREIDVRLTLVRL